MSDTKSFGKYGARHIKGTNTVAGDFYAIKALTDSVIAVLKGPRLVGHDAVAGRQLEVTLSTGNTLEGHFTEITLSAASNEVEAYIVK